MSIVSFFAFLMLGEGRNNRRRRAVRIVTVIKNILLDFNNADDKKVGLSLAFLIFFSLLVTVPFTAEEQVRDSLNWAYQVENVQNLRPLLNPTHLIYLPINLSLFRMLSPWCDSCTGVTSGKIHSILGYVAATVGMFLLVFRLSKSKIIGMSAALVFCLSNVVWEYASQVEPYTPLYAALVFLAWILTGLPRGRSSNLVQLLAVSGLSSIAVLYHQAAVLAVGPLLIYFMAHKGMRLGFRE
jgi:hypothetical protein